MTATNTTTIESVCKLLTTPSAGTQPEDPKPVSLNVAQTEMLNRLIGHFSAEGFRPQERTVDSKGKEKVKAGAPLTAWEACSLLNREALLRCLRADKWDLAKCQARLEETIIWRRSLGGDGIEIEGQAATLKTEAESGKMFTLGFDNIGRPIVHMRPRNQTSGTGGSGHRFPLAFWLIDRAIDLMPPGVESILLVIDLAGPQESPSVKQQKDFVRTLGAHYCERLGQALVCNMPTLFVWVLKDIESYWPALTLECGQRRRARLEKWVKLGKKVGSSELEDEPAGQRASSSSSVSSASTTYSVSMAPSTASTSAPADSSTCTLPEIAHGPAPQALVAVSQ
ncbi:uncharacterized protein PGTG_06335 [Puccinia graminis f. sp. tritici CRL 75-36-700-3]|uniref:CRAL/TRIO N-terminal domain-containing protein n=1 Tax=Puccinia graminis f. sp. tritici (strain CRL 75-36-700-3 / race SCCL) TaxID=418459 RepID=E3K7U1_PUCGT|nr:uncharacterized protein PGTG_06335 [Puccinia graminis f. sp. tritici CRL 75-36-700-3]EFP80379.2 hypothetical protein PGTG_06335 [Puccinia graminis f. sp. tritici CRL 75-36-700-3]